MEKYTIGTSKVISRGYSLFHLFHAYQFLLCRIVNTDEANENDQQEERHSNASSVSEDNEVYSWQDQHRNPYV